MVWWREVIKGDKAVNGREAGYIFVGLHAGPTAGGEHGEQGGWGRGKAKVTGVAGMFGYPSKQGERDFLCRLIAALLSGS